MYSNVVVGNKAKKTKQEILDQQVINNALAAEYKLATPRRRGAILKEYYDGNVGFVVSWRFWDYEHWAELTQIFVSYWHEAFMLYKPKTENSVFNFYMDRKYKSTASQEYKRFIKKEQDSRALEFTNEKGRATPRKEIYIHPQSSFDRITLKRQLSRSLDAQEQIVLEEYFFGDKTLREIEMEAPDSWHGSYLDRGGDKVGFNLRYQRMLDKIYLNCDIEELRMIASQRDADVPVRHEKLYMTEKRREMLKVA